MKHLLLIYALSFSPLLFCQSDKTVKSKTKKIIFGNSWYSGIAYNRTNTNIFNIEIGRTYGKSLTHMWAFSRASTYGVGYGLSQNKIEKSQLFNAFYGYSSWILGGRIDYLLEPFQSIQYLRPSFGLSVTNLDIHYSYTWNLDGKGNSNHGLIVRFKFNLLYSNWETWRNWDGTEYGGDNDL
jgi:hypothetical protein